MQIQFTKMHGLGNDFMVVSWPADAPPPEPALIRRWSDRRTGVGFDQLLIVVPEPQADADARYRIFNADGGEVEQCGNGVRCIARFLSDMPGTVLRLASLGGTIEARLLPEGFVTVSYGEPDFAPAALPFQAASVSDRYRLSLRSGEISIGAVSLGNPHAVIEVDSVDDAPVGILGPEVATHADFPKGVNVGFMQRESRGRLRLRVHERGVGETRACGTAAAAAVAVGRRWGDLDADVDVELPGGVLRMHWPGPGEPLLQTGPTTEVYEGLIEL
jgi:diaminopimelate epimerase